MKKLVILICVVPFALAGCGKSLKEKIVGTWKIDTDMISDKNVPSEIRARPDYASQKAAAFQKMEEGRLEFKADGTFVNTGLPGAKSGKWSLKDMEVVLTDEAGRAGRDMKATVNGDASRIHLGSRDPSSGDPGTDFIRA